MGPSILPLSRQIQSKARQSPGETGSFIHHGGIKAEPEGRADIEVLVGGIHLAMALDMQRQEGTHRLTEMFPYQGERWGTQQAPNLSIPEESAFSGKFPHPFLFFYDCFLSSSLSLLPSLQFPSFHPPFNIEGGAQGLLGARLSSS